MSLVKLSEGLIFRPVVVSGGNGQWAYFIGSAEGVYRIPSVVLETELRIHDPKLAGVYFRCMDKDFVQVYGLTSGPTDEQRDEIVRFLSTPPK